MCVYVALKFKGLNMFNRLLMSLAIIIHLYSSTAYANSYESAVKIFDTNDTIVNKSINGYRSPIFHTRVGYLFTGQNNLGYTSLYFLKNNETTPVEIDIPVAEKAKYYHSDWKALKKIGEDLFVSYLASTDDVFYFDLVSNKLEKWTPYYKLRKNERLTDTLQTFNTQAMSYISWLSVINHEMIIFSADGKVYSYDSNNDILSLLVNDTETLNQLIQNDGEHVYFELNGDIYKTNGKTTVSIISEPTRRQLFIYRNSGDNVSRFKYTNPATDEVNKNAFAIQFEVDSDGTYPKHESLYVVNKNSSYKIEIKEGFEYSRDSGFVSSADELSFLIRKGIGFGDKYEIQHCIISDKVNCDYIEVLPEISGGLTYATLFKTSKKKLLLNTQYPADNNAVDSKVIFVDSATKQTKEININKNKNIVVNILAKTSNEMYLLTKTVIDSKYALYKYSISTDIASELVGLNNYDFSFNDSFINDNHLLTFRTAKISESSLDKEGFYGLYRLDENTKLLNLIFQSNWGRETDNSNPSGIDGIKKINGGIVSSSHRSMNDSPIQPFQGYTFKIYSNLVKKTIYDNTINSWIDTDFGLVFVANNKVYMEDNETVKELYSYSDSSAIRLLTPVSYNNGKVLFSATSSDNYGYILDITNREILPVLSPSSDGYMVSQPAQCGDGVFYAWSDFSSNTTSIWKTNGLSKKKLDLDVNNFSVIDNNSKLLVTLYDNSIPAKEHILSIDCNNYSENTLFTKSDINTYFQDTPANERGDRFISLISNERRDIYYIDEKNLNLQHIYSSSIFDDIYPEAHLIHRTVNGFFYNNSHVFRDKQLIPIPLSSDTSTISTSGKCESDYDDSKGWIICAVTINNDDGLAEDAIRILDTSSMKFSYVRLNYLEPAANIDHLTYSNGRYFFYANVLGVGRELLAIDQNCFNELDSGADSCTLPLFNSAPRVYEHKAERYYQGQYVYLPVRVVDEDLDVLTFKLLTQGDDWLSISNDGVVTGVVPTNANIGAHSFTVEISDGESEISKDIEFEILNRASNSTPSEPPSDPSGNESGEASSGGSMSISLLLLLCFVFFNRLRVCTAMPFSRTTYRVTIHQPPLDIIISDPGRSQNRT